MDNKLYHLKGNTYYISGKTNIGLYILNDKNDVALIDVGDTDDAENIASILKENNFNLTHIIFTHSHRDHTGAAKYLANIYNPIMIASKVERAFFADSKLDIGFLYGGYPLDEYDGRLMHTDENREIHSLDKIPDGLKSFKLKGHHYGMIGIKTSDDVYFVADTLGSINLVDKQHILLIYDVKGYLESLDYVESLTGKTVVPSHSEVTTNIKPVVEFNRNKINEIMALLLDFLKEEHNCVECTQFIFNHYELKISYNKYMLILSTVRSYLSYLSNNKKIKNYFKDNRLVFINDNISND